MAVSRPRSVPASKFRTGIALLGTINGVNLVFTTPEFWVQDTPQVAIQVYFNGVRQALGDDYTVSESSGPGTGHDTVTMLVAPRLGDHLFADYVAV